MDLSDEQQDALSQFRSHFDSDEDAAKALQAGAQAVYQTVYDSGYNDGLGQINDERDRLKQQKEELEQELNAKEKELSELREEVPELEDLRKEWEESELQPLKDELEQKQSRLSELNESRALSQVEKRIRDEVANDWVAKRLVENARDRVDTSGEEPTYLRPDGQTPYAVSGEQDPADAFADDLLGDVPEELRASRNDGSSFGNGDPGSGVKRKPKSEYSRQERAEFYAEQRQKNRDPNEEWAKLPDGDE